MDGAKQNYKTCPDSFVQRPFIQWVIGYIKAYDNDIIKKASVAVDIITKQMHVFVYLNRTRVQSTHPLAASIWSLLLQLWELAGVIPLNNDYPRNLQPEISIHSSVTLRLFNLDFRPMHL